MKCIVCESDEVDIRYKGTTQNDYLCRACGHLFSADTRAGQFGKLVKIGASVGSVVIGAYEIWKVWKKLQGKKNDIDL